MMSYLRKFRWIGCAVLLVWSTSICFAAEPWPAAQFKYYARQSSLVRVLSDFASTFGIGLALDPEVEGKVTGDFSARTPTEFLNSLASSYGFNWYWQAGVLYVSPARDWVTEVLHVGMTASDVSALKAQLSGLSVFESRFGWAEFPERGIVIVSGPASYVGKISSVVGSLGTGPSDGRQLRVFRLQNARADDYTFEYQGQRVVTPGVATLLRNLAAGSMASQYENPSTGPLSVAPSVIEPVQAIPPLTGEGAAGTPPLPSGGQPVSGGKVAVTAGLNALSPVIESDPRLNSVVVYDAPEKMPIYEALIRELDAGRPQIQIEAMIVDVATDKIDTLGVAWRAGGGSVSGGFGGGGNGEGTILSVNTDGFFARVRALVTEGNARILGRPSVLTLDNLSAVLSLSETLYTRVSGLREDRKGGSYGALVPITTGTLLKVIPRLVDENGRRDIALAVEIQDGQIQRDSKDSEETLPSVRQSAINTQAVVRENDCLLIGGYFMESDNLVERRVPGLSRVPLLGALFRDKSGEHKRSARLFVIRPMVVPSSSTLSANLEPSNR
ncbi:type III secretion system outer membrane ring subunit SctC [Peristeroidobacter soli]|uniref:type III secretion system outer membrane ring subunit SctC n=1 Tax=Peristeroidobacter soli TaxID=2497877 RepID=UPI00101DA9F5|nr:type III secretion system outer membrane ring subunit SctC [Peristeroidobacter soli]